MNQNLMSSAVKFFGVIFSLFLISVSLSGQDIAGKWAGVLNIQGARLRVVFNITKTDGGYSSTMDSPDQNAFGIPVSTTAFEDNKLLFEMPNMTIRYEGELKNDSVTGIFRQAGMELPLNLSKNIVEAGPAKRPQEPKQPYPYHSEDIVFSNEAAGITLAGTLTIPAGDGAFPAAILISGSGAQDRNEELWGHKPFLVIADYLTRNGIAVLRYDDRGYGQSTGTFATATTADFALDVESAITWLRTRKEIDQSKIGLIGHSEGGIVAPVVASRGDVGFIVMLAGLGQRGDSLLLLQNELLSRATGVPEQDIEKALKLNSLIFSKIISAQDYLNKEELTEHFSSDMNIVELMPEGTTMERFMDALSSEVKSPWMQYFIRYDPSPVLEKVKCPVFAVNGDKDLQVSSKVNLLIIKNALKNGGNNNVTIKEYPGLNHLFQECSTGLPVEYGTIEQTIAPVVLNDLTEWILGL